MLKVLLVDDEVQVRKGLRWKVEWSEIGLDIIGEAANGKEALTLALELQPDIILTDVRMPIMDGMEFLKALSKEGVASKVIVLSGYADFTYVKQSLTEGVIDYLLKPVDPDELTAALQKCIHVIKMAEEQKQQQEDIRQMMQTHIEDMKEQYVLHMVKEEWTAISHERLKLLRMEALTKENVGIQIATIESRTSTEEERTNQVAAFRSLCRRLTYTQKAIFPFYDTSYPNMMHFLFCDCSENETVYPFIHDLQATMVKELAVVTVVGIGKAVTGLKQLKNAYISSLLAWSESSEGMYSQVMKSSISIDSFELSERYEWKLLDYLEQGEFQLFKKNLLAMLEESEHHSLLSASFALNRVLFLLGATAKKYALLDDDTKHLVWKCQLVIWELSSREYVREQLIDLAKKITTKINNRSHASSTATIVENVREFVEVNYSDDISLTSLADKFAINVGYLSELFKEQVGQNFSDYIQNIRLEKAQQLLLDPRLKVIEVAHLVGYSNSGYFSTVFKKKFGLKPLEYRKSIMEQKEDVDG